MKFALRIQQIWIFLPIPHLFFELWAAIQCFSRWIDSIKDVTVMTQQGQVLVFLILLLCSLGCNGPDDLVVTDITLSSQFNASIYETFENSGKRSVWMHIETREEYSCDNYQLEVVYEKYGTDLYVNINGIIVPENSACVPGINNATRNIEFGPLNQGIYTLHLTLIDEIEETGELINSEESIDVILPSDTWIEMTNPQTKKIPENTIWGYYLSGSGHYDQQAADYIEGLETFGSPLENDGYFGAFSVNQGQLRVIEIDENNTNHFNGFGMRYTGDKELLKNWILDNYCDLGGQLGLQSTNGDLLPCE